MNDGFFITFTEPWYNMKLEEVIYKTPELTEEELLEELSKNESFLSNDLLSVLKAISDLHAIPVNKLILNEWNLIQEKKSNLSRSRRDQINALVGTSVLHLIQKHDEKD